MLKQVNNQAVKKQLKLSDENKLDDSYEPVNASGAQKKQIFLAWDSLQI